MRFHSICILLLFYVLASACTKTATTAEVKQSPSPVAAAQNVDHELERRLKTISDGAQGTVGLKDMKTGEQRALQVAEVVRVVGGDQVD